MYLVLFGTKFMVLNLGVHPPLPEEYVKQQPPSPSTEKMWSILRDILEMVRNKMWDMGARRHGQEGAPAPLEML